MRDCVIDRASLPRMGVLLCVCDRPWLLYRRRLNCLARAIGCGFVSADGRAASLARSIVGLLPRMAEVWLRDPIVHSHSVDPWKLCVCVKYYIVHVYSMPYYTKSYDSTANLLVLEPTALIFISKERRCNEDQRDVGNSKIERVIRVTAVFLRVN